ncbi:MAG: hypothetical protein AAFZ58_01315 [Pseudomonadota bacterium]
MKCSEICYRLRWHVFALAALLAAGCASHLNRLSETTAEARCPTPEVLVCERTFRHRADACRCAPPGEVPRPELPSNTTLGL